MYSTKTTRQKLRNYTRYLDYTLDIYRSALEYVNSIVHVEWANIEHLIGKSRINFTEHQIHSTSKNSAVYRDFDQKFYKFPSYLRRAVIAEAIGNVSSHITRYRQWEDNNKQRIASNKKTKGKPPVFNSACKTFPMFYKDSMSEWLRNGKIALKLYNGSDWIWFTLPFYPINFKRFPESEGWIRQNPILVKKGRGWYLHIPFKKKVVLSERDFVRPVLNIDLGLNHTAVCSIVYSDGTVGHREFISYASEKDRLNILIGKIADKSRKTWLIPEDERFCNSVWRKVGNITNEIAHQCSRRIVGIAKTYNCQTIVFEYLGVISKSNCKYTRVNANRTGIFISGLLYLFGM